MLELIDLNQELSRDQYDSIWDGLKIRLGECQRAARDAGVPVIAVFEGWDAAGKGTVINRFTQALDPRGFKVHPINPPTAEEALRPWMWRFWQATPPAGSFAIFDRSWYGRVLVERMEGHTDAAGVETAWRDMDVFERQLADAGTVIVKFWLHISRKEQRKRFKRLERNDVTAWKVGKAEWRQNEHYEDWLAAVEEMLERTSTPHAPWTIVESTQARYRRVKVFETVIAAVERELERRSAAAPAPPADAGATEPVPGSSILDRVDLGLSLEREEYDAKLAELQKRLFTLEHELYLARVPVIITYEGWDAGGKGGNIRRLTRGLDPRGYEVIPIAAPTTEELAHHYLWRFWRHLPKAGHITIFDRTWYGRVLVERVEGFCTGAEWRRAFSEINEFEKQLTDFGTVLVKFWLQIDREEQLRRFEARQQIEYKEWKITDEDWRNREKWDRYEPAVVDMLERTSTTYAPWTILEANCKLYARVKALQTVADAVEAALAAAK
jgi:polyphosphate:AMP phosphotransferase